MGVFHFLSEKHLQRYVDEAVGRHNGRQEDTMDQISGVVQAMLDKRFKYKELIADPLPESRWVI